MGGRILTGEINCSDIKVTTGLEVEGRTNHVAVSEGTKDLDITINRKEYNIVGDEIYIPKLYDDAPQWLKDLVDVVVEVGVEANNADLLGQVQDLINQLANATVPLNTFTQSIIALNLEDARINTVVETLNSNFSDATSNINAQIIDVRNTFVSKDSAASTIATVLAAEISNGQLKNMATVGHVATALATETAARAADYTALESSIAGESEATATAINTINTYVGIDQAGASTGTGLSAYLVDSNGVVGGADSQVANAVYIDNGVPKSKWEYGSVINISGVNYTSGFGLKTVGSASEFWIDASKLKFTNSNSTGQVAPFTIDASGTTPQVKFNGVVEFSNVSNVPSLGSNNMLVNAGPTLGNETYGWQIGWYNTNIVPTGPTAGFDSWRPTGGGSVYAVVGGSPTVGTAFDLRQSTNIPVVAGNRYEISALLSSHRCTSVCTLAFFNSSGTYISESGAGTANITAYSGNVGNWVRQGGFVTAPAGTAYAQFYVRSTVTGTDPYCFVAKAYMAEASASSTQFSTWGEGLSANSTVIDGAKITTGTVNTDRLNVNSIMSKDITFTGKITGGSGGLGGIIKSYNNKMTIDLVNGSIYIA